MDPVARGKLSEDQAAVLRMLQDQTMQLWKLQKGLLKPSALCLA